MVLMLMKKEATSRSNKGQQCDLDLGPALAFVDAERKCRSSKREKERLCDEVKRHCLLGGVREIRVDSSVKVTVGVKDNKRLFLLFSWPRPDLWQIGFWLTDNRTCNLTNANGIVFIALHQSK